MAGFKLKVIMFRKISTKKPVLSVDDVVSGIFNKLFKKEIERTFVRMKLRLTDSGQIVGKQKFNLIIISLFTFVVEHATVKAFGSSGIKNKILKTFKAYVSQEFEEDILFINEHVQKFHTVYKNKPEEIVMGLGICFSDSINKKNKSDYLSAIVGTTEMSRKLKLITNYYNQLNEDYKIS
jgi:hypothetical protein